MKKLLGDAVILIKLFFSLLMVLCFALLYVIVSIIDGVGDLKRRNAMKKFFINVKEWFSLNRKKT